MALVELYFCLSVCRTIKRIIFHRKANYNTQNKAIVLPGKPNEAGSDFRFSFLLDIDMRIIFNIITPYLMEEHIVWKPTYLRKLN